MSFPMRNMALRHVRPRAFRSESTKSISIHQLGRERKTYLCTFALFGDWYRDLSRVHFVEDSGRDENGLKVFAYSGVASAFPYNAYVSVHKCPGIWVEASAAVESAVLVCILQQKPSSWLNETNGSHKHMFALRKLCEDINGSGCCAKNVTYMHKHKPSVYDVEGFGFEREWFSHVDFSELDIGWKDPRSGFRQWAIYQCQINAVPRWWRVYIDRNDVSFGVCGSSFYCPETSDKSLALSEQTDKRTKPHFPTYGDTP